MDRKKTIDEIVEGVNSIKRKMAHEARCFFTNSEITQTQWMVVKFINEQESANIKDLAENLDVTSSAITQLADSLVKNGYLERSNDINDRRAIKLVLTEKAKKQLALNKSKFWQNFASMFEELSDHELEVYCEINKKIISNLK